MAKRYRLSREASDDLRALHRQGVERIEQMQADRYLLAFGDAFELLAEFPLLGRSAGSSELPLRVQIKGAHVVLYRTGDGGVDILRIYD